MSNQDQGSAFASAIIIIFAFCITAWVFWHYLGETLMHLAFIASRWQFYVYQHLPLIPKTIRAEMAQLANVLPHMNPANYNFGYYVHLWSLCAYGLRLFLLPWLLYLGVSLPFRIKRFKYRRRLSLEQLVEIQSKSVFSVAPIRGLKLHKEHPHIGPWHVAPNPLYYALDHGFLLYKGRDVLKGFTPDERLLDLESKREMLPDYRYVTFDQEKADKHHVNQLGKPWLGVDALQHYPPAYILAALFMARIAGEMDENGKDEGRDDYEALMGKVAFTFVNPEWSRKTGKIIKPALFDVKGAMTLARRMVAKYESNRYVQRRLKRHGFEKTMLMGLLKAARDRSGKLPASEFLWLRPINRDLYMTLNQVGGDTGEVEAHGAWAHFIEEERYGNAIGTPIIEGASDALELHLAKEQWLTTQLEDPEKVQRDRMMAERVSQKEQSKMTRAQGVAYGAARRKK